MRGVAQGFYGQPWSDDQLRHQLDWMAEHGFDTYVHAPKKDPWWRANWRAPMPAQRLAAELDLARAAMGVGIQWIPALSPGWPMLPNRGAPGVPRSAPVRADHPGDIVAVVDRYRPFAEQGCTTFSLLLDDTWKLPTPAACGRAHRILIGSVRTALAELVDDPQLLVGLAIYHGATDSAYLRAVRGEATPSPGFEPGTSVFWTGPAVVASTIEADDASRFGELTGCDGVVLFDNVGVADFSGPEPLSSASRVYLGPYEGRDDRLRNGLAGVIVNPPELPHVGRITLHQVATWLHGNDSADECWDLAIDDAADAAEVDPDALRSFAAMHHDGVATDPATCREPERASVADVDSCLAGLAACDELDRSGSALAGELKPWVEVTRQYLELALAVHRDEPVFRRWAATLATRRIALGDRFVVMHGHVRVGVNVVDRLVVASLAERVRRLAAGTRNVRGKGAC